MIREFHQISLRGRNSFGVDQRAARLVEFETAEDLRTFFAAGIPGRWTVLAGGNNILFTEDYDGVLLTPVARQIALLSDDGDEVRLRVEAGVEWDDLVEWAVERGLWGIENLSLIPGKAGSAPVQNIGAYGCEAKDAIRRVEMYCVETGNLLTLDAAHCGFGYREMERGFFSKAQYEKIGILTSGSIQDHYFEAVQQRKCVEVSTDYLLIEISKYKNLYVDGSNVGISTENVDMKT